MYVYNIDVTVVASVIELSCRSLSRWYTQFQATCNVERQRSRSKTSKWPPRVCEHVRAYIKYHPCFYFEKLRDEIKRAFKEQNVNVSDATICRALQFDLGLSRKILTRRAKESVPRERREYASRLLHFYSGPDQLVFIDETSKDGR